MLYVEGNTERDGPNAKATAFPENLDSGAKFDAPSEPCEITKQGKFLSLDRARKARIMLDFEQRNGFRASKEHLSSSKEHNWPNLQASGTLPINVSVSMTDTH